MATPTLKELGVDEKGLCFINGEFVPPASNEWIDVVNPATEEVFFHMPRGTKPDVDKVNLLVAISFTI